MKHLKTFEAYGYEYTYNNEEDLNEGFAEIKDSIFNFIRKNIMGAIPKEALDKITTEFRQDLPKLTPQFVNFSPKEKEKIVQSIAKLQSSLPKMKGLDKISESDGAMTFSSEPMKSKDEELNTFEKIFRNYILPVIGGIGGVSYIMVIWKVVFEWMIGHRALSPLEVGIWGKIALITLLLTTLATAIIGSMDKEKKDKFLKRWEL
jgi:rubrerythrin